MDKSPDAFRTISEVSDVLDTPAHVLRFWESRFPQIRPVKRAGGRRYYRPSDVALLAGIKRLLHDDGLTIRGVQQILRDQGVRHVSALAGGTIVGDTVLEFAVEEDFVVTSLAGEPAEIEAAFISVAEEEMEDADARLPEQALLPLFDQDPAMADANLPPLVLSRRASFREDASFASLIRTLPRGALARKSAEVTVLALRLRALRAEMFTRSQGAQG